MKNSILVARLAALEIMIFAMAQRLQSSDFKKDLEEQKEIAIIALSNTLTSDETIQYLEATLDRYEEFLGLHK